MSEMQNVARVIGSSPDDWLVTLCLRDGTVRTRRIAPGQITDDAALKLTLQIDKVNPADVADAHVRRVSQDREIHTERLEETLGQLLERMRRG